ncbi:hypothetical protein [Intestinibacter sp.]|uniref:hypothetical protein n=1 Tax=Intestinibacter sp. TaxID=1965304 RepID=UPI003F171FC2
MTNIPLTNKDKQYLDLSEITDYSNTLTGQENGDYIYRRSPINTEGINLKDTFNVQFTGRDPKTVQLDDEDGTVNAKHIQVDLSNCYYANSTDKKAVTLHLAASIFTKAFTCST